MLKAENNETIEPISHRREQQVRLKTGEIIRQASLIYNHPLPIIPVLFDLKGRAAGMYKVNSSKRIIRYNPYLFAKYFDDNVETTVPHEVAHYVVDILYGASRVKPHGVEWQQVMLSLGAEPRATGNYNLSGIPVRKQQRHAYRCACTRHHISTARHNKILRGQARYYCRNCKAALTSIDS
ncbi:MAG: SprT-like domain-containing protein [Gammaproteobacteria bacterium]|jgi:SprT protein